MSKFIQKIQAQKLRRKGFSIKDISKKLLVSKSTTSVWCRDIKLSPTQTRDLIKLKDKYVTMGRLKGARVQKEKRLKRLEVAKQEAQKLKKLSINEFWIAGLSLYLAEGSKTMGRVQFTNTNPKMIRFMLRWFKKFYNISKSDIRCSVLISQVHIKRDGLIKRYWQKYLNIKPEIFTDIRYTKTNPSKIYSNHDNYFGTFSFRVNKSSNILYKINALNERLLNL
ncbi:MAG: hypothetical protein AAB638_00215 [Patescibacteria group bacterium]